jgi:hypothetical protein
MDSKYGGGMDERIKRPKHRGNFPVGKSITSTNYYLECGLFFIIRKKWIVVERRGEKFIEIISWYKYNAGKNIAQEIHSKINFHKS